MHCDMLKVYLDNIIFQKNTFKARLCNCVYFLLACTLPCVHTHMHILVHPLLISRSAGVEAAMKAMELANGYVMREKPLIISYGRARTIDTQCTADSAVS